MISKDCIEGAGLVLGRFDGEQHIFAFFHQVDSESDAALLFPPSRAGDPPPFACNCSLRLYYDRNLLNRPKLEFF